MPKVVGIIGGMGPAACVDLFAKLVAATPAQHDQDHLRILIDNNPRIPNRNDAIAGVGPSPGPHLAAAARGLEQAGADFLVIACNTAHAFQPDIEAAVTIPLLSMIEATADAATAITGARIGVLAADGCRNAGLYQRAFAQRGADAIFLSDDAQAAFMDLVYAIKAGDVGPGARERMAAFAQTLREAGAQAIVAACTEVPLVLTEQTARAPLINSTDALVARAVAVAFAD
ncbi:MAG: amino acid racemase [Hyphomonadaceae bacterium]|nr:amino acid racemase [Hyphomonadaceae bacterium]